MSQITLAADSNSNVLEMNVSFVEPTGSDTFVTAKAGEVSLVCRISNEFSPSLGDRILVKPDVNKLHFFSADHGTRFE
jgi:ABC-type sugar transport system ATPase subunit